MANKTEFYGMISGKVGLSFSKALNQSLEEGMIVNNWETISEFQRYAGSNSAEELRGLTAIMITDYAFGDINDAPAREFAFHFMQSMFLQKELYGVHLLLFTKDAELYELLTAKYENDPSVKYEGTKVLYNPTDYTVTSIKGILKSPFNLLSYGDKKKRELEEYLEKAQEQENKRMSYKGFMMLLGKQQALQEQLDHIQRELLIVNRNVISYATAITNDDLDAVVSDIKHGIEEDVKEQFEKIR